MGKGLCCLGDLRGGLIVLRLPAREFGAVVDVPGMEARAVPREVGPPAAAEHAGLAPEVLLHGLSGRLGRPALGLEQHRGIGRDVAGEGPMVPF